MPEPARRNQIASCNLHHNPKSENDTGFSYRSQDADCSVWSGGGASGIITVAAELPTLYCHYTAGGVVSGLSDAQAHFTLNGRSVTLYSGAMHYFRIPPAAWRDRLRKARAAGLNVVETYVPWNLHEPRPGVFEWGDGRSGSDHAQFLDIKRYLQIAQEEDLLAIVRPGPYICSEWEFGGLPSWLLREPNIKVRTSDEKFMKHVTRYFNALLTLLATLQFTKGGPIIALQIENEYGSTRRGGKPVDKVYLNALKQLMLDNGIVELLFTSDDVVVRGDAGSVPGVLQTANFQKNPRNHFKRLQEIQPGKPVMAMEYWTGWFDHWSEQHHRRSATAFADVLQQILEYPASVNMYMFHGGTNWGFLNGANIKDRNIDNRGFQPDTTSYDYDACLSEAGDYTDKYVEARDLISRYNSVPIRLPKPPDLIPRVAYSSVLITEHLPLQDLENQVGDKVNSPELLSMENLPINNNTGQQYGYIVYKKTNIDIPANSVLMISNRVCDSVMVLVNSDLKSKTLQTNEDLNGFGYWRAQDSTLDLGPLEVTNATLELVVENWGRNNFGSLPQFVQFKGLWQGPVFINDVELSDWEIIPLEFRTKWIKSLTGWKKYSVSGPVTGPGLYRAEFTVAMPRDTYIDMRNWTKGFVVVNGFVLGRHAIIGPQFCLYLPASFIKQGENEILVFEHFKPATELHFVTDPVGPDPVLPSRNFKVSLQGRVLIILFYGLITISGLFMLTSICFKPAIRCYCSGLTRLKPCCPCRKFKVFLQSLLLRILFYGLIVIGVLLIIIRIYIVDRQVYYVTDWVIL